MSNIYMYQQNVQLLCLITLNNVYITLNGNNCNIFSLFILDNDPFCSNLFNFLALENCF